MMNLTIGDDAESRLESLLSESLESVRHRQHETLGLIIGGEQAPFVLFGAGGLGRQVLPVLRSAGLHPLAFIDNNSALWGSNIDGVEIFGPAQLAERMSGCLPAVVASIGAVRVSNSHLDGWRIPLRSLGFQRIALFGHLAWRFPQLLPYQCLDLPERVLAESDRVRRAFRLLADENSRSVYVSHVAWRLTLDSDMLPMEGGEPIYFSDRFSARDDDEVLYDIGAFNGDSILGYLESGRRYREVHSFEPSEGNFGHLQRTIAGLAEVGHIGLHAHLLAVGDHEGSIAIGSEGGHTLKVGEGDGTASMTTLDVLAEHLAPPSFVKMDIEGFEPQCLAGARRLIAEKQPVLAVCSYHEQDHLWRLLLQVHSYHAGYHFMLGQHLYEKAWDIVLYAIPQSRLPKGAK
jgi:FkbM family methyltransferase